jgi:hypothetical protein
MRTSLSRGALGVLFYVYRLIPLGIAFVYRNCHFAILVESTYHVIAVTFGCGKTSANII